MRWSEATRYSPASSATCWREQAGAAHPIDLGNTENLAVLGLRREAVVMSPLSGQLGGRQSRFWRPRLSRHRALRAEPARRSLLIDLTTALEDQPAARLRAPSAERERTASKPAAIQVIAHPAAIALAMLLTTLAKRATIRKSIVHIFEPASERGKKGLDELRQQTVAVLSFHKLKTDVFDAQLSFNHVGALRRRGHGTSGASSSVSSATWPRAEAAYPAIPMPSLRLIQAPVAHGHSFSDGSNSRKIRPPHWRALLVEADVDVRPDDPRRTSVSRAK